MRFVDVMKELKSGKKLRRSETWEHTTVMYSDGEHLLVQRGNGEPYRYDLSWFEIVATDWSLAN